MGHEVSETKASRDQFGLELYSLSLRIEHDISLLNITWEEDIFSGVFIFTTNTI